MGWACGAYGWGEGGCIGSWWGKRPLGRPRRRWVVNIRMDLQEVVCGNVDWIGLAQDRDRWRTLMSAVMNLRVPWNAGDFLTSCKPFSCSRRTLHHGVSKYVTSTQESFKLPAFCRLRLNLQVYPYENISEITVLVTKAKNVKASNEIVCKH